MASEDARPAGTSDIAAHALTGPVRPVPGTLLPEFGAVAGKQADATALVAPDATYTYHALHMRRAAAGPCGCSRRASAPKTWSPYCCRAPPTRSSRCSPSSPPEPRTCPWTAATRRSASPACSPTRAPACCSPSATSPHGSRRTCPHCAWTIRTAPRRRPPCHPIPSKTSSAPGRSRRTTPRTYCSRRARPDAPRVWWSSTAP